MERLDRRLWLRLRMAAEEEVRSLLKALPAPVRERVAGIPIVFEATPTPAMVRDGLDPDLLGLFQGYACDESEEQPVTTEVFLFLQNIWEDAAHDTSEYREQVRQTLLHEIGHYLGLEEDDLIDRDLE